MPRKTKAQKDAAILETALKQFDATWALEQDCRTRSMSMRRFVNVPGAQWEWDVHGVFANRMMFEVNKVALACTRIKNEFRNNEISSKFLPSDGSNADALADTCASRYRSDTFNLKGKLARQNAFDEMIDGGIAGWRLRAEYEAEEKEYQRICAEPIHDAAISMFFDANAKAADKSDSRHGFVLRPYTREAFEAEFPGKQGTWPGGDRNGLVFDWFTADVVYVAEYFLLEKRTVTKRVLKAVVGDDMQEFIDGEGEDEIEEMLVSGYVEAEPEKEKIDRVVKYVMTGADILSGPEVLAGRLLPIIPVYAHYTVINNVPRWRGHAEMGRDPQIIKNIQISKIAEVAAQSPVEKPIFTPEQVAGHSEDWRDDHIKNNAFLLLNPIIDAQGNPMPAGPIAFTKAPDVQPAVAALVQIAEQDVQDILGNPQNGEKLEPQTSGTAMEMVQNRIDMQTYGYIAAMSVAEMRAAEVWLSMASDIYYEKGRKLKVITEDGQRSSVEIGRKVLNAKTGAVEGEVDFSKAAFDVEVDVGPTTQSRRQSTVRSVTSLIGLSQDPEMQTVLGHVALMNMEGEGLSDLREWSRQKLVAAGAVQPTKEEQADIDAASAEPPPPDPQAVLAGAMAEEASAKAKKAEADTALADARALQAKADTAKVLAEIPISQRKAAVENAKTIMGTVNERPNGED